MNKITESDLSRIVRSVLNERRVSDSELIKDMTIRDIVDVVNSFSNKQVSVKEVKENKNPNKLKRLFSNLLGEDFYNTIIPIDSYDDVPSSFDMPKGLYDMMNDHDGSIYYFVINGFPYVYMDMGKHEWFFDNHGRTLRLRHIESMLDYKISDFGYRFRDVIDLFNEGKPLNENVNGSEKIKNLLKKTLEDQEFEISFEIERPNFDISLDWDEYGVDSMVGNYTIKFHVKVGDVTGEGSNAVASVNVIIVGIEKDGDDFYYNWADDGYADYTWYIHDFSYNLREELFSNFPFKIHPIFYGYDEKRKS